MKVFEKFAALLFLLLLVGMILFLTYVPVPDESKQVILIIIGGLMTTAAGALPNLFGSDDGEKVKLRDKVEQLGTRLSNLDAKYTELKENYDILIQTLVSEHVIHTPDED